MTTPTLTIPTYDHMTRLSTDISQKDHYKLLIGCVVPRPIAFVSTCSPEGVTNIAPFSFFNAVASNPPSIVFSVTRRGSDGEKKDTLKNIEATSEFVVSVVTEHNVVLANQASAEYPTDRSEFAATGLTPLPSTLVKPPRLAQSPVNMECKLLQLVPVGDGSLGSSTLVIGEIVCYHLAPEMVHEGRMDIAQLKPVSRLAGSAYAPVRDIFDLPRPVI